MQLFEKNDVVLSTTPNLALSGALRFYEAVFVPEKKEKKKNNPNWTPAGKNLLSGWNDFLSKLRFTNTISLAG